MRILILSLFITSLFPLNGFSQTDVIPLPVVVNDQLITFRFIPGNDIFYLQGNQSELNRLYSLIDHYRTEIASGQIPVFVDSYCTSLPNGLENRNTAFVRANRVKSELIVRKELRETNFITKNYPTAYEGHSDMVVVSLRIPVEHAEQHIDESAPTTEQKAVPVASGPSPAEETGEAIVTLPDTYTANPGHKPYFALKTNLTPWAGTVMNIAAEVQVGRNISIEFPLMWCPWKVSVRHSVKGFAAQPEARWWLSRSGTGHFFGAHAHVAWFNVRWKDDRYQDASRPLLGGGLSYGYLLPQGERWAGEFTLGAGYANIRYNTYYNIGNGARIDTRTKNYWGITRVGISIVYRFNPN